MSSSVSNGSGQGSSKVNELLIRIDELNAKIDQLYMRPRMPHTQSANGGDILGFEDNGEPYWKEPCIVSC